MAGLLHLDHLRILVVRWLLGLVSATTFGGFIHVLLWLTIAVVLLRARETSERIFNLVQLLAP